MNNCFESLGLIFPEFCKGFQGYFDIFAMKRLLFPKKIPITSHFISDLRFFDNFLWKHRNFFLKQFFKQLIMSIICYYPTSDHSFFDSLLFFHFFFSKGIFLGRYFFDKQFLYFRTKGKIIVVLKNVIVLFFLFEEIKFSCWLCLHYLLYVGLEIICHTISGMFSEKIKHFCTGVA